MKENDIETLLYSELAETQPAENQIQHLELQFSSKDLPQYQPTTFASKTQPSLLKQFPNETGYAFEDQSIGLISPIHTMDSETKIDSVTSSLLEGNQADLQSYLELSNDQKVVLPHLELLDKFDPFLIDGSAQRSKSAVKRPRMIRIRGAASNPENADFTFSLMVPVLQHLHSAKDHSLNSLLPILNNNAQAQAYTELSNENSSLRAGTIEHFELFPFENAVKAKNASDGMISSHADEMLRFKRFFKSLIKELGENPEMTLAQISAKVGQLYNPFTGKPAEKYFFLKLLKEAKKISYRALIRNNKVSSRYGYPSLSSSKELVTAVSQILSSSGLDGDQQYTKNTDSLLPEVCFIISIYSHHVGFKFSWNSVHDCQIMIFY